MLPQVYACERGGRVVLQLTGRGRASASALEADQGSRPGDEATHIAPFIAARLSGDHRGEDEKAAHHRCWSKSGTLDDYKDSLPMFSDVF